MCDYTANTCEYQRLWGTKAPFMATSDATNLVIYHSYSCVLIFCKYPERTCEVKKNYVP